jgi:hypothetical protein
MYSPKIYESQIPCLYHAAQNLEVPMTQLANAYVYYGLISGYYGQAATELPPRPNEVLPENVFPRMQIFNPLFDSIVDYMNSLPVMGTLNPYFQTLEQSKVIRLDAKREGENEPVPF